MSFVDHSNPDWTPVARPCRLLAFELVGASENVTLQAGNQDWIVSQINIVQQGLGNWFNYADIDGIPFIGLPASGGLITQQFLFQFVVIPNQAVLTVRTDMGTDYTGSNVWWSFWGWKRGLNDFE